MPVLFCGLRSAGASNNGGAIPSLQSAGAAVSVQDCYKGRIIDRVMLIIQLMASGRFFVVRECENVVAAFSEALWDSKHEDTRLDDGTSDIDTCDAVEYAIASFADKFCLR